MLVFARPHILWWRGKQLEVLLYPIKLEVAPDYLDAETSCSILLQDSLQVRPVVPYSLRAYMGGGCVTNLETVRRKEDMFVYKKQVNT